MGGLMNPKDWYNLAYQTGTSGMRGEEMALEKAVKMAQTAKLMKALRDEKAAQDAMTGVNPFKQLVETDYSQLSGGFLPAEDQVYGVPAQAITQVRKPPAEMIEEAALSLESKGLFNQARTLRKSHAEDTKSQMDALTSGIELVRKASRAYGDNWREVFSNIPNPSIQALANAPIDTDPKGNTIIKNNKGVPIGMWVENPDDGKLKYVDIKNPASYMEYLMSKDDPGYLQFQRDKKQAITVNTGSGKRDRKQAFIDDDGNVTIVNLDNPEDVKTAKGAKGKTKSSKSKKTRAWQTDSSPSANTGSRFKVTEVK